MRQHLIIWGLIFGLMATWAVAQTYVDTPGGKMNAAAGFVWNGTAWVAITQ